MQKQESFSLALLALLTTSTPFLLTLPMSGQDIIQAVLFLNDFPQRQSDERFRQKEML